MDGRPTRERRAVERLDPSVWRGVSSSSTVATDAQKRAQGKRKKELARAEQKRADYAAARELSWLQPGEELLVRSRLPDARRLAFLLVLHKRSVNLPPEVVQKIFDFVAEVRSVWKFIKVTGGRVEVTEVNFNRYAPTVTRSAALVAKMLKSGELIKVARTSATPTIVTISAKRAVDNRSAVASDAHVNAALAPWRAARPAFQQTGCLGSFTPPCISLEALCRGVRAIACTATPPAIPPDASSPIFDPSADVPWSSFPAPGFEPFEPVLDTVAMPAGWRAYVRAQCASRLSPAVILSGSQRACESGEPSFHVELAHAFVATDQGPCVGGDSWLLLADGSHKPVCECQVGDRVAVAGDDGRGAVVQAVWRAQAGRALPMCTLSGVLVTPDHPISMRGVWCLPPAVSTPTPVHVDAVYNLLLSPPSTMYLRAADPRHDQLDGRGSYVACATLAQSVPGFEDPLWGTVRIAELMAKLPGFPYVTTAC